MIYELSRTARRKIEEIIRYTDEHFGPLQTEDYIGGLYYSFDLLTDNPRMGRQFDKTRRRYVYRSHLVYYRIFRYRIRIVDIRHAKQGGPEQ